MVASPAPAVVRPEVRELCAALCRLGACSVPEVRELVRAVVSGAMAVPRWERATVSVAVEEGVMAAVNVEG
jgi:hypothetical protein